MTACRASSQHGDKRTSGVRGSWFERVPCSTDVPAPHEVCGNVVAAAAAQNRLTLNVLPAEHIRMKAQHPAPDVSWSRMT